MGESRTDSIEDAQRLDLSAVGFLVDNDRRVNIGSILFPVVDLLIDVFVGGLCVAPCRPRFATETILDTLHSCIPVETSELVSALRAILVDHRVAG